MTPLEELWYTINAYGRRELDGEQTEFEEVEMMHDQHELWCFIVYQPDEILEVILNDVMHLGRKAVRRGLHRKICNTLAILQDRNECTKEFREAQKNFPHVLFPESVTTQIINSIPWNWWMLKVFLDFLVAEEIVDRVLCADPSQPQCVGDNRFHVVTKGALFTLTSGHDPTQFFPPDVSFFLLKRAVLKTQRSLKRVGTSSDTSRKRRRVNNSIKT